MMMVAYLRTPRAIREQCQKVFDHVKAGGGHFSIHEDRLPALADFVVEVTRRRYPKLDIPFHGRLLHLQIEGKTRLNQLPLSVNPVERLRQIFDVIAMSVFLDAGAGPNWKYKTGTKTWQRSEGLAIAAFDMVRSGFFSNKPDEPLRADGHRLTQITSSELAQRFQVSKDNEIVGLEGRTQLLRQLGAQLLAYRDIFGEQGRLGNIADAMLRQSKHSTLKAANILDTILLAFNPIWPNTLRLNDVPLGDVWHYPPLGAEGYVPFHKLSQWLSYSLFAPLENYHTKVVDADELTGLAEYRNGGLFLDFGVINLTDPHQANVAHQPGSPVIVEWRALTINLLDKLAAIVREKLGDPNMPLGRILEGGTWAAGREIAKQKRPDGGPPLKVDSDGTVF
jgi:hypothetical protein